MTKRIIKTTFLTIFVVVFFTLIFNIEERKKEFADTDIINTGEEVSDDKIIEEEKEHIIDIEYINQYPELPSGCEAVSLTMALNYLGFNLGKEYIADNYLIYGSSYVESYAGSIRGYAGGGCFAPCITRTANRFLHDESSSYRATDITGKSIEELLEYIKNDIPVIIWNTMYMMQPTFEGSVIKYNDIEYKWYDEEHCMVLCGFDNNTNELIIADPIEGIVRRDRSTYEMIYDECGRNCVIVK